MIYVSDLLVVISQPDDHMHNHLSFLKTKNENKIKNLANLD